MPFQVKIQCSQAMKNLLDCKSRGPILLGSPVCVVFAFRSRPFLSGCASCKPASKYSHTLYLISVKQAMVVLIKEDTNADNSRSLRRAHFMSHSLSTDPLFSLPALMGYTICHVILSTHTFDGGS